MDELHTMSNQEITRLEAMQRIKDKRLTQKEAARMLNSVFGRSSGYTEPIKSVERKG